MSSVFPSVVQSAQELLKGLKGKPVEGMQRREAAVELAGLMMQEAALLQTKEEKKQQAQLARMMDDLTGKVFTTCMTDQCFRSSNPWRSADQLSYLIGHFGTPRYLSFDARLGLNIFHTFGKALPSFFVPMTRWMLRKETSKVILPGEDEPLRRHMQKRRLEGVRINLNHLGEAILGEEEAKNRLETYLEDLKKPEVEYVSIKISTIYSQINLLAWEETLEKLSEKLRELYRAAKNNYFVRADGSKVLKFVNLDMEEYRDLHLTVELFQKVLDEPEFLNCSAGIVLQSYLPDSYAIQKELTAWAKNRVSKGGAPIKIRIVKGANLAMEKVEASMRGWQAAPYATKAEVDANFKRMVTFGMSQKNHTYANLGIASHNLFDISYALCLRAENDAEKEVGLEMLEGMADHIRRAVQVVSGDILLYCPVATKEEFQNAVAYLVRRLDENTSPDNFLRHVFHLTPGSEAWNEQVRLFKLACEQKDTVSAESRREIALPQSEIADPFENASDSDWALKESRQKALEALNRWKDKSIELIVPVVGGKEVKTEAVAKGIDPSFPNKTLYSYCLAGLPELETAISTAKIEEGRFGTSSVKERSELLFKVACLMRQKRNELISAMTADCAKTIPEGDVEISEAIDFVEYYRRNVEEIQHLQDLEWSPKGTVLIASPWNFPCSIPTGGISAALAAGNSVIFKPAQEAILAGWELAKIFWEAGVPKEVLQFVPCLDDPVGTALIKDPRINVIVLTGATETAKLFLKFRPGLDLMAETGGKNALIITAISDRDLAIKDLVHSAFGHSGQKCSACSLGILEKEVYDDPHFLKQLKDAVTSLKVGPAWDPSSKVIPLITPPHATLMEGLTKLDEGESWLVKPQQNEANPHLWSPGVKLGVKKGSRSHQKEFFGPVLSLMRAENLQEAIELANGTPYGLTSGLHSLDEREHQIWLEKIEAGNCYINRGITGAIVQRQPFGGIKDSSFGAGIKAGGPNYVMQLMKARQKSLPQESGPLTATVEELVEALGEKFYPPEEKQAFLASIKSYAFYWNSYFLHDHDPSQVIGQDNILQYLPLQSLTLRVSASDPELEVFKVIAAALTCGTALEISADPSAAAFIKQGSWFKKAEFLTLVAEDENAFIDRVSHGAVKRLRLLSEPSAKLEKALADNGVSTCNAMPFANGRVELLRFLREVSISSDYHRYGNLGKREQSLNSCETPVSQASCCNQACPCGA